MAQALSIGDRVKGLRKKKGWTQEVLAENLHMGRTSLKNKELGTRDFTPDELLELSQVFGVTLDWLIRGVKTENLSIYESVGLDDAAIKGLQTHNTGFTDEEDFSYIQPDPALNKALATPVILDALSHYMSFDAGTNNFFVGMTRAQPSQGFVDCRMSNGMYQAALGQNLLRVLDAVKRGEEPELYTASMVFDPVPDDEGGKENAEKE